MSIVKNPDLFFSGKQKIEWVKDFMPVLTTIGEQLEKEQTFQGLRIGMSIHMEAKTAYLAYILKKAGAEVSATGCNTLSTQDDVAAGLAKLGVSVYAIHGASEEVYQEHLLRVIYDKPDLIIDDGGDLLEAYCNLPELSKRPIIGGCEETTTGVLRLYVREKSGTLPFPMVNVNDAKCKHYYDNKYGTGQSVWDGIMHTTNILVAGKTVVVAGYGYCGRGIAMRARGMGAKVVVTEIDPVKALEAILDGFEVMPMEDAACIGDFFITATGCKDVITIKHLLLMKDNAFLANAGHFNVEINLQDLDQISIVSAPRRENITGYITQNGRTLNVLAEGKLVNLASGNGHPAEIMDMSFALQILGLKYLVENQGKLSNSVYNIPPEIDNLVAWTKLDAIGTKIDYLNTEQKAYLGLTE